MYGLMQRKLCNQSAGLEIKMAKYDYQQAYESYTEFHQDVINGL
jgi:hypothetical protein